MSFIHYLLKNKDRRRRCTAFVLAGTLLASGCAPVAHADDEATEPPASDLAPTPQRLGVPERTRNDMVRPADVMHDKQMEKKDDRMETRQELQTERQENRVQQQENRLERQMERQEDRTTRLSDLRMGRIRAYAERMLARFRAAIARLNRIADRIESRIEKLQERGLDLGTAIGFLREGRAAITEAQTALASIPGTVETALADNDPRTAFAAVHEAFRSAKESLKNAHAALVNAIRVIKAVTDTETGETTTSDENHS